jgi:hypothetical protein
MAKNRATLSRKDRKERQKTKVILALIQDLQAFLCGLCLCPRLGLSPRYRSLLSPYRGHKQEQGATAGYDFAREKVLSFRFKSSI